VDDGLEKTMDDHLIRCAWPGTDALMIAYHDTEWGTPVHDDRLWFEHLVLDGFQAGLSWRTILHRRPGFRQVFHGFEIERVAAMTEAELEAARLNPAIIRNRRKIAAAVSNARAFLALRQEHGSFDAFIWSFTGGRTIHNQWQHPEQVPASTALSDQVSAALRAAGFSFVGSTICYSVLQAAGVINDHLVSCFRHRQLEEEQVGQDTDGPAR
jgi:DNA-3-methyladenine glycosylase I